MSKIRDELVELIVLQAGITTRWENGHDCSIAREARDTQLGKIVKQIDTLVLSAQMYLDHTKDINSVCATELNLCNALAPFQELGIKLKGE